VAQQGFRYQKGAILGVLTAAAILCKWFVALLIPGIFGLYAMLLDRNFLRTGIHTAFITSISLVLSGIWTWYAYTHYPQEFLWEQQFNARHFWETIEDHSGAWWYFLDKARIQWNEGIYVIFLFFLYQTFSKRNQSDLLILAWVLLPYLIFSASATKMNGYVLITAPAVFILMASFCQSVLSFKNRPLLWQIVIGLILIFAIRYCIERVKPFQHNPIALQQAAQIKALQSRLPNNAKTLIFNNKISIETMFYTNMISSRNLPSPNDIRIARDHFNTIAIIKTPDLPDYLLMDSSLVIFELPE
jgi:4-amino-4-deoxy-L-arabinose transferase